LAVTAADKAIADLRAFGREGDQAFKRLAAAHKDLDKAGGAVDRFTEKTKLLRSGLLNSGHQIADFATQVASGQNVMVAATQQVAQLAAGFGPLGIAVGAGAAVLGAVTQAIIGFNSESESTPDALANIIGSFGDAEAAADRYTKALAGATEEQRRFAEAAARAQLGPLRQQGQATIAELFESLAGTQVQTGRGRGFVNPGGTVTFTEIGSPTATSVNVKAQLDAAIAAGKPDDVRRIARENGLLSTEVGVAIMDRAAALAASVAGADSLASGEAALLARLHSLPVPQSRGAGSILDYSGGRLPREALEAEAEAAEEAARQREQAAEQAARQAKQTADQVARETATRAARVETIKIEAAELARLDAANQNSAAAYRETQIQIEAERAVRALGTEATKEQTDAVYAATVAAERHKDEIKAQNEALRDQQRAYETAGKAIDDFNRRMGDRIEGMLDGGTGRDPWEEATDRLQNATADAIRGGMEEGFNAESIIDGFTDVLKSSISESIAASVFESFDLKKALGTQLGSLAPSLQGTQLGSATVGQVGTSALAAGFGGYAIGQATGNRAIGLLGGAGAGALAGAPLGLPGIIGGAAIGGLAGLLGGGSGGGTRNNNYRLGYNVVTGRQVDFMNTKPDQANISNVNAVLAELGTLRQGLRGFGIALGETELTIQSGNRSGLTLNGDAFSSLGGLTEAALDRLLSAANLTAEQRRVAGASNATNAQGLLADLGFIDEFRQLIGAMSPLQAEAKALAASFATARDRATELGFSQAELAQLTNAERFARAELAQQAGRERGNILDATAATMGDDAAALRIALRNQAAEYDQLRQRLEDLGGTSAQLERLSRDEAAARAHLIRTTREQARAAREAERQSLLQTRAGFAGEAQGIFSFLPDLQNFGASIATSGIGSGTRLDQFQALQAEYQRTLRMARGGDQTALGNVDDLGRQYLAAARDVYASGPRFAELEAQVRGNIDSLADKFGKLQRDHFADLMADNRNNVITQTNTLVRKLDDLQKAFEKAGFGDLYRRRAS
jgi:hypothetical protein